MRSHFFVPFFSNVGSTIHHVPDTKDTAFFGGYRLAAFAIRNVGNHSPTFSNHTNKNIAVR